METIILEIRQAEGGDDSALLVKELSTIYQKACELNSFTFKTLQ